MRTSLGSAFIPRSSLSVATTGSPSSNGNYEPHTHISAYESSVATLDNEKTSFSQHLLREAFGFGAVAAFLLMVASGFLLYVRRLQQGRNMVLREVVPQTSLVASPTPKRKDLEFANFVVSFGQVRYQGAPQFFQLREGDGMKMSEPKHNPDLPTLFFIPGLDGTGVSAQQQFPRLAENFNLWALSVPVENRSSFDELVNHVTAFIEETMAAVPTDAPTRPVYVMGESFGSCVTLAVAAQCKRVNRVVIINPATSFSRTVWPTGAPLLTEIPEPVYPLVTLLLAPVLGNPINLALVGVDKESNPFAQVNRFASNLATTLPALRGLANILPPDTLTHKIGLLKAASDALTDDVLKSVEQRTLMFGADQDLLLPSEEEVKRLAGKLRRGRAKVVPGRSHAMLMEVGVDLQQMIDDEGFYTRDLKMSGNGKGPLSIEVPTQKELLVTTDGIGLQRLEAAVSPVFMSVGPDGKLQRGCGGVDWGKGPILIVSNHQTLAPDLGPIVKTLLKDEGVLPRGLSHPAVTGDKDEGGAGSFASLFRQFGAVTVSGRNLYDLMAGDEVALLYPGGVREAYKQKGEDYELFWPVKPEFVRVAARFNATIVPLAAVGADDGVEMLLDSNDILNLPVLGDLARQRLENIPSARQTIDSGMGAENFIAPVVLPKVTEIPRWYFMFGQPIYTDCNMDRERCAEIYQEAKDSISASLQWLLEKREEDPYQYIGPRALYETTWGKQAPTFPSLEGATLPWTGLVKNKEPLEEPESCLLDDSVLEEDPEEPEEEVVLEAEPVKEAPPGELVSEDWYPEDD
jgi:pimeloyl-ACP methyl ester carboxylesterase/1-acyl-sn-glycerol-3-phosphate acyltransferase|eukprot:CAMPEP_0174303952 /NCGR_PEP_ID=MMETSP0809-20121228/60485_1 /TAXON_ID=73025 ORGANISM="Eutreptiella gymnastica-like, Strain CCMP1594" /NCGR_SAMPLE_ID=MMETSP0809 /ASSEMBLY_ACC=CAM_ASM_000658 /LENGTH=801 /DNA_ID=CAMNT_0015410071 /DNA_START=237 /DNA_END=2642 /DNA_ORIENTATION=-